MASSDCSRNKDPLKLMREGTSQDGRLYAALNPDHAPLNQREIEHGIVFAQDYSALLKYFDTANQESGDWHPFFSRDVAAKLALLAVENIEAYKTIQMSWFDFLNNRDNELQEDKLKDRLGFLFGSLGTLAKQLDVVKEALPAEIALKATLQNLIKTRLAPAFKELITYYKGGDNLNLVNNAVPSPPVLVLRTAVAGFDPVLVADFLTQDWSDGQPWDGYVTSITANESVYGSNPGVFEKINHCAGHALFKAIFDNFLQVLARVVSDAARELEQMLSTFDKHEPHYALFLAFLRLLEHARNAGNKLTQKHLDFYYRDILQINEKAAEPSQVHLLAQLAKQTTSRNFKEGELFKAGKDSMGRDAYFANDRDFVANKAVVSAQMTVYRHTDEKAVAAIESGNNAGRLYASPIANSDDGLGAELTNADLSWHPFYNKIYRNDVLSEIRMPNAELGFVIASHYLLMQQGTRTITIDFTLRDGMEQPLDAKSDIVCMLTIDKEWFTVEAPAISLFKAEQGSTNLQLKINLSGGDPAIVPYDSSDHGYNLGVELPVLLVKLLHRNGEEFVYSQLETLSVTAINLSVEVEELKTLAISNDFGPIDASKPYQPFGSLPGAGSSLVIGSKEVFQKNIDTLDAKIQWQPSAVAYTGTPQVNVQLLAKGEWENTGTTEDIENPTPSIDLLDSIDGALVDEPDYESDETFSTNSRYGYARLSLSSGLGHADYRAALVAYQLALAEYLAKDDITTKPQEPTGVPVAPSISQLSLHYVASTSLSLDTFDEDTYRNRKLRFIHLTPFGSAEQHAYLTGSDSVALVPQFGIESSTGFSTSNAEFYIGISGLVPPQNLSLLFQVVEGSANPLSVKPKDHIHWSYLSKNNWIDFANNEIEDATAGLIKSGIVTFAMPRQATKDNSLFPSGMYWLRAAVHEKSDAVCRLQLVAAQALEATFTDRDNAPDFATTALPAGTISKLDPPDATVKSINQPFASFDGRAAEQSTAFYSRVAERLRHKDRANSLWDYEHLILEAFLQIYKVKCLNHTQYEPTEDSLGIYRELAPGHVTIVTVPKQTTQQQRNPLKPYTSLGLLSEIEDFLNKRVSCLAQLHVNNPQFEEVWVRFNLRLYEGYDVTFYTKELKKAIVRFLSPWAFSEGNNLKSGDAGVETTKARKEGGPSFGGKIYKSVLIDFIEGQPYVDYVADFKLYRGISSTIDLEEVVGSTAVSILVSAPEEQHDIVPIIVDPESSAPNETCNCEL